MISWTENVHILSFWNFERSLIGQHGLALGILTQFIDDHQRALCGNVENTCSLVSMIPAGGFTGDFQSNSATPILTWKSGWPYHLVIITCSKKRCSKKKKCHCRGYIKLVVSQVAPRAFLPWRWRCLMKILLSSAVVDTRDSLWIDEYVCVYIHTYVSMYYIILHIMHKHTSSFFLQILIYTNFQPIEISHASQTQPLSCMSDAPTRHLRPMLQDFIDKLVTQISNLVDMRKCWPECTDISELPNMMESKHGRTALRPGMEKLNRVWKMLWDSIFRRLHRNTNQDLFTSAKHQLLTSMLHSSWLSGHGTKLPIWFSKAMIATDLEDDGRAWNQSKQPKFLRAKILISHL